MVIRLCDICDENNIMWELLDLEKNKIKMESVMESINYGMLIW